jgi:hypothetical protein
MMKKWIGCAGMLVFLHLLSAQTYMDFKVEKKVSGGIAPASMQPWNAKVMSVEAPDFFSQPDKWRLRKAKEAAAQWHGQQANKGASFQGITATLPPPVAIAGMNGNGFNSSVPLDNYLAVNNEEEILSVANTTFRTYNGQTLAGTLSSTLTLFTSSLGLTGTGDSKYDPKVLYDPEADRFIAVILNGFEFTTSRIILAFSQTSDPKGDWHFYTLPGSPFGDSTWFDFPSIAITQQELFITGNQVRSGVSWQAGFSQSVIWQVGKTEGYAGQTLQTRLWSDIGFGGRRIRNLHPVKAAHGLGGPEQRFLSNRNFAVQNDSIFYLTISGLQQDPTCSLDVKVLTTNVPYGLAPDARQPVLPDSLATNDARVLGAIWYENEIHFASNTAVPGTGNAGIYFGVMNDFRSATPTITGHIIGFDTLDLGYPNVGFMGRKPNGKLRSLIAFNHTGPQTFPGYSMCFYEDGEFSDVVRVVSGTHSIDVLNGNYERWGDYFGIQPFYPVHGWVWLAGTFGSTNNRHRTWLSKIESPYGTSPVGITSPSPTSSALVYPNPTESPRLWTRFTAPSQGELKVRVLQTNGQEVGLVFQGPVKKGDNELGFDVGHLPYGNYILELKGVVTLTETFIRR